MWSQVNSKISYHAVYDADILEALRFAHLHGFSGIQIAVESPHLNVNQLQKAELSQIKAFCEQNGLHITLHGDLMMSPHCLSKTSPCNMALCNITGIYLMSQHVSMYG